MDCKHEKLIESILDIEEDGLTKGKGDEFLSDQNWLCHECSKPGSPGLTVRIPQSALAEARAKRAK